MAGSLWCAVDARRSGTAARNDPLEASYRKSRFLFTAGHQNVTHLASTSPPALGLYDALNMYSQWREASGVRWMQEDAVLQHGVPVRPLEESPQEGVQADEERIRSGLSDGCVETFLLIIRVCCFLLL